MAGVGAGGVGVEAYAGMRSAEGVRVCVRVYVCVISQVEWQR